MAGLSARFPDLPHIDESPESETVAKDDLEDDTYAVPFADAADAKVKVTRDLDKPPPKPSRLYPTPMTQLPTPPPVPRKSFEAHASDLSIQPEIGEDCVMYPGMSQHAAESQYMLGDPTDKVKIVLIDDSKKHRVRKLTIDNELNVKYKEKRVRAPTIRVVIVGFSVILAIILAFALVLSLATRWVINCVHFLRYLCEMFAPTPVKVYVGKQQHQIMA